MTFKYGPTCCCDPPAAGCVGRAFRPGDPLWKDLGGGVYEVDFVYRSEAINFGCSPTWPAGTPIGDLTATLDVLDADTGSAWKTFSLSCEDSPLYRYFVSDSDFGRIIQGNAKPNGGDPVSVGFSADLSPNYLSTLGYEGTVADALAFVPEPSVLAAFDLSLEAKGYLSKLLTDRPPERLRFRLTTDAPDPVINVTCTTTLATFGCGLASEFQGLAVRDPDVSLPGVGSPLAPISQGQTVDGDLRPCGAFLTYWNGGRTTSINDDENPPGLVVLTGGFSIARSFAFWRDTDQYVITAGASAERAEYDGTSNVERRIGSAAWEKRYNADWSPGSLGTITLDLINATDGEDRPIGFGQTVETFDWRGATCTVTIDG